jgi:hypothetical protein
MKIIELTPEQIKVSKPILAALDARREGIVQGMEIAKAVFIQSLLKGEIPYDDGRTERPIESAVHNAATQGAAGSAEYAATANGANIQPGGDGPARGEWWHKQPANGATGQPDAAVGNGHSD